MAYSVGIVGAGMGGLAAAAYLAQDGHSVTVFDKFDAPAPVGSGLVVQPVGQEVLSDLGVLDLALSLGQKITSMEGFEVDHGRKVLGVEYGAGFGLAIHRASLFHALLTSARAAKVELATGAEVTDISEARVHIGARREGPFDLIINASGANSSLSPIKSRALPYGAVWGTVPWPGGSELPNQQLQQRYQRASKMIGILPVGRLPEDETPIATVFWSLPREDYGAWRAAPLEAWKAEATGLWPEMAPFLETITAHEDMTMARYTHGTLLRPVRGRVVHLGDAAHRASPQLGQGANMALLDAAALSRALAELDMDLALQNYTKARRGHVWLYQLLSASFTPQYQSDSRALPWVRDRLLYPVSQIPPIPKILTRLVRGDLVPPFASLSPRLKS